MRASPVHLSAPVAALLASVASVALAACGGDPKPAVEEPTPPSASLVDCATVGSHIAKILPADRPRPGATPAAVQDMVSTRCRDDAWSDETKRCVFAVKTIAEARECASTMTDEQRTAIRTQARALRADAAGSADTDDASADWVRHVVEEPVKK